jgi:hypothetical protein
MRQEGPQPRGTFGYQVAVLGISALVIGLIAATAIRGLQGLVGDPAAVALGLTAAGQVVGATAPHGPAAESLPGLAGTATPTNTPTTTPTRIPTATPTMSPTPTLTLTPDVRTYDPNRAKTLLAQAQTSWGSEPTSFLANVSLASDKINGRQIAPYATFSFNTTAGPYDSFAGYRLNPIESRTVTDTQALVDSGVTQVSTTLFQAAFWSGLKIVERQPHASWLDRFNAGSTGQRGLDAVLAYGSTDLRFQNNTSDWIRIEASVQSGSLTVSIYGADPGWSVDPIIGDPTKVVQPNLTPVLRTDPEVPMGQQFTISSAAPGFDINVERTVTKDGNVVDRYGLNEHYVPLRSVVAVGPTPTPSPTATPVAVVPTVSAGSAGPTHLAGLNPASFVLPDGRIRVPAVIGLSETEAQQVIAAVGLATTYPNYQGPGDVPAQVLNGVEVGQVLSQNPSAGSPVQKGTTVYLAIRKQ